MKFIKSFGLGLLYLLLLPLILVCCAIIAMIGIVNFVVQFVIMLINFFKGKSLLPKFKKDVEAEAILKERYEAKTGVNQKENNSTPVAQPTPTFIQQNFYANPQGQFPPFPNMPQGNMQGSYPNVNQLPNTQQQNGNPQQIPLQNTIDMTDNGGKNND